jgi:ATP-dependent helicase/nuclease subunit A
MQFVDFSATTKDKLCENINQLKLSNKISDDELAEINLDKIVELLNNADFKNIISSGVILREQEFLMNTGSSADVQIVQGVVDLIALDNGEAVIVDYKTGRADSPENMKKYAKQLSLYADAVEKAYGTKVKRLAIVAIEKAKVYDVCRG